MSTPVDHYEVRYRRADTVGAWTTISLPAGATSVSIPGVVRGYTYQVEARSVGPNGAASQWIQQTHTTAYATYLAPGQTQNAIGAGSVVGEAFGDGTAGVVCTPFQTSSGVSYFPGGAVTLTGLQQQQRYYVYVVDPGNTGGNLTPVATPNQSDYLGRAGYLLIDTVITPLNGSGIANRRYPTAGSDSGSRTTLNPGRAYDGDLSTYATVSSSSRAIGNGTSKTIGIFNLSGWASYVLPTPATLTVTASASIQVGGTAQILMSYVNNGTQGGTLNSWNSSGGQQTYTVQIPAGTDLSSLSLQAVSTAEDNPPQNTTATVSLELVEVYVQT